MTYKNDFLIEELQKFYNENGRVPLAKDMGLNHGYPSCGSYQRCFGTWNKALKPGNKCDNFWGDRTGCENNATVCLSRTHLKIEISHDDHVHVCESCFKDLLGKTHEFR